MEGQEYEYQTDYTQDYSADPTANGDGNFEQGGEYDQSGPNRATSGHEEDLDRKIFVGGLSWETTVKDLREYFSKFGEVVDCTLKTDQNTGRSRGFGFVMFSDPSTVDKVVTERTHLLHGRNIDPKRAKARGGREPIKKVFVGGLDPSIPETEIRDHFGQFGKIEEIDLPFDKMKNQRRAFCFITFESEEVVDRVCEKPKQSISGKEVDVKKATPKPEHRFGYDQSGGYGGGYGAPGGRGGRGGGPRGRGRGSGNSGWGNQGSWGGNQGYDYNNYYNQGYGSGYDYYNQGYGGYPGYDYSNYYSQGWGGYGQGGYGSYGGDE